MPRLDITNDNQKKARTITLVLTKSCNLKCIYCYEKHDLRSKEEMDFSVAQERIKSYMEASDKFERIVIEFFGGEPMLCFPLIRKIFEWFDSQTWEKPYKFLIGTNGTILTEEMKNWLYINRNKINVALSLDGNRTAHNITRDNSYDMIYKNLNFFVKYWYNQPVKMTVIGETIPYLADSIIELEEMGINFTANLAFENFWGDEAQKERLLKIYEEQLSQLVEYYAERSDLYPVKPILAPIPDSLGLPKADNYKENRDTVRFCGSGHEMVVVDVDGATYPCHRFLPWVTGRPAPNGNVNCQTYWKPKKCADCKFIVSCPTCAGFNWEVNGDTGERTTYHCESYKMEVLASAKLEALKLTSLLSELNKLSIDQKRQIKGRIEAIWDLVENGI